MKPRIVLIGIVYVVLIVLSLHTVSLAEALVAVSLEDVDSGTTSPTGNYRWMDSADQVYASNYQTNYSYTQANVQVDYFTNATTLHGTLTALNLKPNFTYQFKLAGYPDVDLAGNERIGLTGRWWQEQWNNSLGQWSGGQNLNNKGDGSAPNPNDNTYFARRDEVDSDSPTGKKYRHTAYLVFAYFITDDQGDASLSFEADSSYHVLWKTSQRSRTDNDGPLKTSTFDADPASSPAYDTDYSETTASVFGEWERLPIGDVTLSAGTYQAEFLLTEESFHGSGLAGGWAGAMAGYASFSIVPEPVPGDVDGDGWVAGSDLSIIITYWGQTGLGREFGDLNGNGTVDGPDYSEVITYWGTGSPPEPPSGIPEPATLGLLLIGGLALSTRSRLSLLGRRRFLL